VRTACQEGEEVSGAEKGVAIRVAERILAMTAAI